MQIGILIPILRTLMTSVGGALIAKGILDQGSADLLSGVVLNAVPLAWWFFDRKKINDANK